MITERPTVDGALDPSLTTRERAETIQVESRSGGERNGRKLISRDRALKLDRNDTDTDRGGERRIPRFQDSPSRYPPNRSLLELSAPYTAAKVKAARVEDSSSSSLGKESK